MLYLERKVGETIICGENGDIILTVVWIKGGTVKIGFLANEAIPIYREEVWEQKKRIKAKTKMVCLEEKIARVHDAKKLPTSVSTSS